MNVLILTCNTGEGHNSVAGAMEDVILRAGQRCGRADTLSFVSKLVSKIVAQGHVRIYRHMPSAFRIGYRAAENHPDAFERKSTIYRLLSLGVDKLYRHIVEGEYDTVICPHAFSAVLVTAMKEKYPDLPLRSYFFATDYTCHPMVKESNMDAFFIPDESLRQDFVDKGVPNERIFAVGLPVRAAFMTPVDRAQAQEACGITDGQRHVLMMCGSMGCGPLEELTKELSQVLPPDTYLSVVCGTNERLYRRLTRRFSDCSNVRILGFVTNIPTLMSGSALYLTKPGGLSVTEAANRRLPMVFVNAVAGCEEYNLQYFVSRGMAKTADEPRELAALCVSLLADESALAHMREQMQLHFNTDAARSAFDVMMREYELAGQQTGERSET